MQVVPIGKTLLKFLNNKEFSDIKFEVGLQKEVLYGHKLLLSITSGFFKSLFYSNQKWEETKVGSNNIIIPDIEPNVFKLVLEFCYTKKIAFSLEKLFSLLLASDKFQIPELKNYCLHFFNQNLNVINCLKIYDSIFNQSQQELETFPLFKKIINRLDRFIRRHSSKIFCQSNCLNELSNDLVVHCLKYNNLNVKEIDLLERLIERSFFQHKNEKRKDRENEKEEEEDNEKEMENEKEIENENENEEEEEEDNNHNLSNKITTSLDTFLPFIQKNLICQEDLSKLEKKYKIKIKLPLRKGFTNENNSNEHTFNSIVVEKNDKENNKQKKDSQQEQEQENKNENENENEKEKNKDETEREKVLKKVTIKEGIKKKKRYNKENLKVLILHCTEINEEFRKLIALDIIKSIQSTGIKNVDHINLALGGKEKLTLENFQRYDSIFLTFGDDYIPDRSSLGDLLADYVEDGGGLVICSIACCLPDEDLNLQGRIITDGFCPVNRGVAVEGVATTLGEVLLPNHPIMKDVKSWDGGKYSWHIKTDQMKKDATPIAKLSDNTVFIATKKKSPSSGTVIFLNTIPISDGILGSGNMFLLASDGRTILANVAEFAGID
ncbi:btb/poz domain-containing [Anaeramoeba flamelloides]|uniref:Btb/poz domain-containing n=1 Tax=Anaeramoeba flamelloides TaxID=1746091 RepID=A0ABQ8YDI8_9EUKA|nr:btb/poz domain-containing [Anaeramoeba flamelloides]